MLLEWLYGYVNDGVGGEDKREIDAIREVRENKKSVCLRERERQRQRDRDRDRQTDGERAGS